MSEILMLGIAVLIFFALRSVMLWYWNINTIVLNQTRTNDLLRKILIEMQDGKTEEPVEPEETRFKPIVPHQR